MLMDLLSKATTVAMLSFVISSMLAMGAGLTVAQIVAPLRNARLVTVALLANFVLIPLGAFALTKGLWLDEPLGVGLLLLDCAAGRHSQSSEDRAIARAGDVVAPRRRANRKGALRGISRTNQAAARLALQYQSYPLDLADLRDEFRQGPPGLWHAWHPSSTAIHRVWLRHWLVAGRPRQRYATSVGAWNRATQHRRRASGRKSKFQRSAGHCHGDRRGSYRIGHAHAARSRPRQIGCRSAS